MSDRFVGTWELDPTTLDYQYGRPGRRAVYVIEPCGDGLTFKLDCDDADGNPMKIEYGSKLDGTAQPVPGGKAGMSLVLRREDQRYIESLLIVEGNVLDRWTREVSEDGLTMWVTQHVANPEGGELLNRSLYRKRA